MEHKAEPIGPNVRSGVPEISVRSHGTSITIVQGNKEDFFKQFMHCHGLDLNSFFCVLDALLVFAFKKP